MNRFLRALTFLIPYLTAEIIQYSLFTVIILTGRFVNMSDEQKYTLSAFIVAVCGITYFFWYRYEIRDKVRGSVKALFSAKYLILLLMLGIGCQFFSSAVMSLLKPLFINTFSDYSEVLQNLTSGNDIMVILLIGLIAPVTEELIFRGVTMHFTNRFIPFAKANILQAVLFGIYHGNVVQGIYACLLGLLLGVSYYKFKTIFAPILLHMIINASAMLVTFIPEATAGYIIAAVTGGICILIALFLLKPAGPLLSPAEQDKLPL